ncbi:MAG: MlaE family lipid ABC transporter permease subunit [Gammaproteobacteria bacterium]|jgi:phospholipid/cholesterol/gamma-HCH transport system permease protein
MQEQIQLTINDQNPQDIKLSLAGRLDIHTASSIWDKCMDMQAKFQPNDLTIDAKNLTYCDGAGIALLQKLQQLQHRLHKQFSIDGLQKNLQETLNKVTERIAKTPQHGKPHYAFREKLGHIATDLIIGARENITFIGGIFFYLWKSCLRPQDLRWKDLYYAIENVGPNAIPIVILLGFVIGFISAFQSALPLETFGAQIYIANLVGIALVRELGPLMTAVLLISRTSSSFAAEIGTMKINQEIDALVTMGLSPIRFLTVTRVIATTLMTPLLSAFLILFGLIGCFIVIHFLGFNFNIFLSQLESAISMSDFLGGLVKSIVFGFLAGSIGCLYGLKTKMGASAVGFSTTRAVVNGIILLIIIDGIFSYIYYLMGI